MRKNVTERKTRLILVFALLLTTAMALTACGSNTANLAESEIFSKMDTVDIDGNKVDSSVFAENDLTLVNLWNVGCTPCIEEMPVLDQLNTEYAGKGAAIKGLYYSEGSTLTDEEQKEIREIMDNAGATFGQLTLSDAMIKDSVITGIQGFPSTFLVNSEGKIIDQVAGSNDYEGWKKIIEDGLEKVKANE